MRIVVLTDVHANLPALRAALKAVRAEGYDAIFHTGDAIGIGPFPAETLDLLLATPRLHCVMGNHDACFVDGMPQPQPKGMSDGALRHHLWTHAQIDPQLRPVVAQWPFLLQCQGDDVETTSVHYRLGPSGRGFAAIIQHPTVAELDALFAAYHASLVFYGHHHAVSDVQGRARYINPGSLGCYHLPVARFAVVECQPARFSIEHRSVPYDDTALFEALEERDVPDREFLYRVFFGGRFHTQGLTHGSRPSC
jgi:predicted phosphodiesterase